MDSLYAWLHRSGLRSFLAFFRTVPGCAAERGRQYKIDAKKSCICAA